MQTTNNVFCTFCNRDQPVISYSAEVRIKQKLRDPINLNSYEYDLLSYCRLSFSRYFTENCVNFLNTMMLTLFYFKPIFPVGKLIGDIIEDLLGKC